MKSIVVDDQNLAGLHIAKVGLIDQIKLAGLRRHYIRIAQLSETQRSEASLIADRDQIVFSEEHHRISALYFAERVDDRSDKIDRPRTGNLVKHNFGVRCG